MSFILFYNTKYLKKKKKIIKSKNKKITKVIFLKNNFRYNEDDLNFLSMLLGSLTKHGKKAKAYRIFSDFLFLLKIKKYDSFSALYSGLNKIRPHILLYNKKRGTSLFELPRLLSLNQEKGIAVRWLINAALKSKKSMSEALADEVDKILLNKSDILKIKKRILTVSRENRPFFYLLKKR